MGQETRLATRFHGSGATNIIVYVVVLVAVISQVVWFALFSGHRLLVPPGTGWIAAGGCGAGGRLVGGGGAFGRHGPELSPAWDCQSGSAAGFTRPAAAAVAVDLLTTTPDDFPQFLGPKRNLVVERIRLARDWDQNPPRQLWRQAIGAGWSAFAAVNGFAVTMEQRGPAEMVTCYDAASGALAWSHEVQTRHESVLGGVGPRSTPTIDQGRVYALGAAGVLRCLDGATGQALWIHDLLAMHGMTPESDMQAVAWGRAASPLVVGQMVVVPVGGPRDGPKVTLAAFDTTTGQKVWEGGHEQAAYASPALATLAGVPQIVIVNESSVSGHSLATGEPLWQYPWPGQSNAAASTSQAVAVDEQRVLVSKGYGEGAELFRVTLAAGKWHTERIWKENVLKTKLTNVVVHQGHIYGLDDGVLSCVELDTGRRRWKRGRYGHGQILLAGDVLLVLSEAGELSMVEPVPDGQRVLGQLPVLDGKTWNNLCLYGPRLLVRNAEEAACYELPISEETVGAR